MSFFSKQVDKRISAYQQELIATHYAEVENMYQKMRGWRHDYRNHIQAMKAFAARDASIALSNKFPIITHRSISEVVNDTGMSASALTGILCACAREILLPIMASIILFPVLITVSTVDSADKTGPFYSNGLFARYAARMGGFYNASSAAVSVAFTGVVYAFVCLKAWAGAFAIGEVTQYIASITKVSTGVSMLVRVVGDLRNNVPFLKENFRFLDIPNTMYQGSLTVEKRKDCNYEVEFKDVSFRYPGSDVWALRNINMKFRIGKRLAVVGRNGSGKTTFIKLLCRHLYQTCFGALLIIIHPRCNILPKRKGK